MSASDIPKQDPLPKFPSYNLPRVWFVAAAETPVAIALIREVIKHGDRVLAGVLPSLLEANDGRIWELRELHQDFGNEHALRNKFRVVPLDVRIPGQCQATIAEAILVFGKIDILLLCGTEVLVGTVEELSQTDRSRSLIRNQFEPNFFGPVNVIKAALPVLREQNNGHIVILTGTTGHLGTPGLGMYCASQWAIEGYCDSLAYEVAPFNIKITIVQPNIEVNVLTSKITSVPPLQQHPLATDAAPSFRYVLGRLMSKLHGDRRQARSDPISSTETISFVPSLPEIFKNCLIAETVHALTAIGGSDNPPARHIVSFAGMTSVKEKLKAVSEELEDFVSVSAAADIEGACVGRFQRRV